MVDYRDTAKVGSFSDESAQSLLAKLTAFREGLSLEEKALLTELVSSGQGATAFEKAADFRAAAQRSLEYLALKSVHVERMKDDGAWMQWAAANGGS